MRPVLARAPHVLALLLALALGACVPTTSEAPPLSIRPQPIVGGTEAPDDTAVVALVARRTRCAGDPLTLLCSGVLIAPDVVLTAAHCLDIFGPEGPYEVYLGARLLPEPETSGRFVRVTRAVRHPAFDAQTHAHDAALLRLARPAGVAPVPLLEAASGALRVGARARVLGYGDTKDAAAPSGTRRQGGLEVTRVEAAAFFAGPAPGMSCVGDSGGPVLVRDGEREVLAGVTASGDVACRAEAFNVRVDVLREDFLQPFLDAAPPALERVLAPEALCRESCTRDEECPSGLLCSLLPGEPGRCLLPALQEGDFGAACADDAACGAGGLCARLETEGDGACRCFTPCGEPPPPDAEGCASAPGAALTGLWVLAMALRPRTRGGVRRGC
ncbi:trypsin-like serine protease [Myxococcaceae bacterium GXIMD 01537]